MGEPVSSDDPTNSYQLKSIRFGPQKERPLLPPPPPELLYLHVNNTNNNSNNTNNTNNNTNNTNTNISPQLVVLLEPKEKSILFANSELIQPFREEIEFNIYKGMNIGPK